MNEVNTLDTWREQARGLLAQGIFPHQAIWSGVNQLSLFKPKSDAGNHHFKVPNEFTELAEVIACYRGDERWSLLYQLVYRLTHGEPHLLRITTDPLMHVLRRMEKAVRRDMHKMKAFVRFRLVEAEGEEHYIAWHRPDHLIVQCVAPFFARRFTTMRWSILTPDASAHWGLSRLTFGEGCSAEDAPDNDQLEDLWRSYYRSIFNPARIKLKAMKREMPVRHWQTLPETSIIADMLAEAPERVQEMLKHSEGSLLSAADFLPELRTLPDLREAAKACQGCELFKPATQTVFGEGPAHVRLMIIGEQPGDEEDKKGSPFVGPAGQLLMAALSELSLRREDVYITNTVKHFRFYEKQGFRSHRTPAKSHMHACKPWLTAEIQAVKPKVILCLGNTAAQSLLGVGFTMKFGRGVWHEQTPPVIATYHPSAILRASGEEQQAMRRMMLEDITKAMLRAGH